MISNSTWLVTGGLGFIGVNLVGRLLRLGHCVRVFDNFSTGSLSSLNAMFEEEAVDPAVRNKVQVVRGDVRDARAVASTIAGCRVAIHLAAFTDVVESVRQPLTALHVNALGSANLLDAARLAGCNTVTLASSSAAVGEADPPVNEEVVPRPLSPYGAGKLATEAIASGYAGAYGLHTVSLRFANVYGAYSLHKGSVVARFMRQILAGEPLTLFDGGRPTRDYIDVEDIVSGILAASERGRPGEVYQLATGVETTVLELVDLLRETTGREIETIVAPPRPGEIRRNFADISKARRDLGFDPQLDLAEGLGRLWPKYQRAYAS